MRTTSAAMKIVKRTDRNTRALAKVVSAIEYLRDAYTDPQVIADPVDLLRDAQFDIIQERRNLRIQLWAELDKQSKG